MSAKSFRFCSAKKYKSKQKAFCLRAKNGNKKVSRCLRTTQAKRCVQFGYVTKIWYIWVKIIVKMGKNTSNITRKHFGIFIRERSKILVDMARWAKLFVLPINALLEREEKKRKEKLIKSLEVGEK